MKFGLFYLPTYLPEIRDAQAHYRGIIEQVEFAERIGIDYVWLVEHHFVRHGGLFPANYAFLSYLAARTKRIRLGTGATVLPLNDPVRVAEQAATLDQLSQGRLDFGVGRGFIRDEFDAFGVDMKDSRERVEEGVELVKQAWAGPTLEFKSKFRPPMSGLPILPPIYQKPHPPIWVACLLSPESFEWTAQEGYNLLYVAYHVDHPIAVERIGWSATPCASTAAASRTTRSAASTMRTSSTARTTTGCSRPCTRRWANMPPPGWKRPANRPTPPPTRAMSSATPVSASSPSNPTSQAVC